LTELPTLSPISPLGSILSDIERAIDARLYYPALLAALTIPEICTTLALDRNVFVKEKHYVTFVDKYAVGLGLSGTECYRLRGGVVHRANMAGHPLFSSSHVIFTLPETKAGQARLAVHAVTLASGGSKAATFDLITFCSAMIAAARKWYEEHHSDPKVLANMTALIRYCPKGLPPFFVGQPIVASGT